MKALALAPSHNTHGKVDATGAFQPEAAAFARLHGAELRTFDSRKPLAARRDETERLLAEHTGLGCVAFFCHGWKDGAQFGHRRGDIWRLAEALQDACTPSPVIALYCCATGRDDDASEIDDKADVMGGDGGFADMLRDDLRKRGVRATIFAHATDGHTTRNPFVRRFAPDEAAGGRWVVTPPSAAVQAGAAYSARLWARWRDALAKTSLRLRFPLLTDGEIGAELGRSSTYPPVVG